jgi:hypothetical protein
VSGGKKSWFAQCQEACTKDAERAFGVLQAQFGLVPCTYLEERLDVGDHECMCYHAQYHH